MLCDDPFVTLVIVHECVTFYTREGGQCCARRVVAVSRMHGFNGCGTLLMVSGEPRGQGSIKYILSGKGIFQNQIVCESA